MCSEGKTTAATLSRACCAASRYRSACSSSSLAQIARHSWTTATAGRSGATCAWTRAYRAPLKAAMLLTRTTSGRCSSSSRRVKRRGRPPSGCMKIGSGASFSASRRWIRCGGRDQDADRFDPVSPGSGPELLQQGDVEAADPAAQLAAPLGRDRPDREQAGHQPPRRRRQAPLEPTRHGPSPGATGAAPANLPGGRQASRCADIRRSVIRPRAGRPWPRRPGRRGPGWRSPGTPGRACGRPRG